MGANDVDVDKLRGHCKAQGGLERLNKLCRMTTARWRT